MAVRVDERRDLTEVLRLGRTRAEDDDRQRPPAFVVPRRGRRRRRGPSGVETPAHGAAGSSLIIPKMSPARARTGSTAAARRSARCIHGERGVRDGGRRATFGVARGQAPEGLVVGHALGRALEDQVDALERIDYRAAGVAGRCSALEGPGAAHEVDLAVVPDAPTPALCGRPSVASRRGRSVRWVVSFASSAWSARDQGIGSRW